MRPVGAVERRRQRVLARVPPPLAITVPTATHAIAGLERTPAHFTMCPTAATAPLLAVSANLKLLLAYDPLNNNNKNDPGTYSDFHVLMNAGGCWLDAGPAGPAGTAARVLPPLRQACGGWA